MASAIFFAIKEAIIAARKEENLGAEFEFHTPATAARIRMACGGRFVKEVNNSTKKILT